jgi:hypothetical protein
MLGGHPLVAGQHAPLETEIVLVEGDQHLLGRKRMSVEVQRHLRLLPSFDGTIGGRLPISYVMLERRAALAAGKGPGEKK